MKTKPSTKRIICIVLGVVAAVLLAAGAYAWHLYSQIAEVFTHGNAGSLSQTTKTPEGEETIDIEASGDRNYNILVLGMDYDDGATDRDYAEGMANTDVIMYVQINRDTGAINIFQIPRDSFYGFDMGEGKAPIYGKINEVYAHGPNSENKINNIANIIYEMFGLRVDDYATIDMKAFKTMLNNMGGIEMYVPWDIITVDKETGKEDTVCAQGTHKVSGDTAELILRNRNYAQADYKRLETQQYFYAALVKSLLNDYTLADYYSTCKVIAHYINTSLDLGDLWGLYATIMKVDPENIYIVRAPGGSANIEQYNQVYYIDRDSCARILNEHFRAEGAEVPAEELGLVAGYDYLYGMNVDEGRTMGSVMGNAAAGEAQLQSVADDAA